MIKSLRLIGATLLCCALSVGVRAEFITQASKGRLNSENADVPRSLATSAISTTNIPLIKSYTLDYAVWAHLGEPAEKFEFTWQMDESEDLGSTIVPFSVSRLDHYPDLLKRFRAIAPTRLELLVDVEFIVDGKVIAHGERLVRPDLVMPSGKRPPLTVAGSPRWQDVLLGSVCQEIGTLGMWDDVLPRREYAQMLSQIEGFHCNDDDELRGRATKYLYLVSDEIRLSAPRIVEYEFPAGAIDRIYREWFERENLDPSDYFAFGSSVYSGSAFADRRLADEFAASSKELARSTQREQAQRAARERMQREREKFSAEQRERDRIYALQQEAKRDAAKAEEYRVFRQEQTHGKALSGAMEMSRDMDRFAEQAGQVVGGWVQRNAEAKRKREAAKARRIAAEQREMAEARRKYGAEVKAVKASYGAKLDAEFQGYRDELPLDMAQEALEALFARTSLGPEAAWPEYAALGDNLASANWKGVERSAARIQQRFGALPGTVSKSELRGLLEYAGALGKAASPGPYPLSEAIGLVDNALAFLPPGPLRERAESTRKRWRADLAVALLGFYSGAPESVPEDIWAVREKWRAVDKETQDFSVERMQTYREYHDLFHGIDLASPRFNKSHGNVRKFLSTLADLAYRHGHLAVARRATEDFVLMIARETSLEEPMPFWHGALAYDKSQYNWNGLREMGFLRSRVLRDLGAPTAQAFNAFGRFTYGYRDPQVVMIRSHRGLLCLDKSDWACAAQLAFDVQHDINDLNRHTILLRGEKWIKPQMDVAIAGYVGGTRGGDFKPKFFTAKSFQRMAEIYAKQREEPYPPLLDGYLMVKDVKRARKFTFGKGYAGMTVDTSDGMAKVGRVAPSGPAALAGVKSGDELVAINGDAVETLGSEILTSEDVYQRIRGISSREAAEFTVNRDGEVLVFSTPLVNNSKFAKVFKARMGS